LISWAEENGQIRASVGPFIERRMIERKIPLYRQQFPTKGDKAVRAQAIRGRMALEGLHVPTKAPWFAAFQQELLTFPTSKHDDQVDALGLIGQMLAMFMPGRRPPKDKVKKYPQDDAYQAIQNERELRSWLHGEDWHNWVLSDGREGYDWKAM
jgi:hypothetical protein